MCHVIFCPRAPCLIILSAVPHIGFDVLADKVHPQHASSVATVLATMQLTTTQRRSDADDDADVNKDNKDAMQTTDNNADDR